MAQVDNALRQAKVTLESADREGLWKYLVDSGQKAAEVAHLGFFA